MKKSAAIVAGIVLMAGAAATVQRTPCSGSFVLRDFSTPASVEKIDDTVRALPEASRASRKADIILEVDPRGEFRTTDDLCIAIESIEKIDGGVQVFARAWKDGQQIGFGADGSVDIERFRIFNPPVLVPDEAGEVVRESTDYKTGKTKTYRLREDPEAAILQSLVHTISVMKNAHTGTEIVPGKIGNTTSTFYPAAGQVSPVDGRVFRDAVNETFGTIRGGNGTGAQDLTTENQITGLRATATTNQYQTIHRSVFGFDTSTLPDTDVISSATISVASAGAHELGNGDDQVDVVSASGLASPSSLTAADYQNAFGTTRFATGKLISTLSSSAGTYNDWPLNATGIAAINKTTNTFLGMRGKWDVDNSFTGSWSSNGYTLFYGRYADYTGTTADPKLVVEHAAPAAVSEDVILFE